MRAYIPNEESHFTYPEDMKLILDYLSQNGELKIRPQTVEDYYYRFSDEEYCASWLCVNPEMLEEFAEYLSEIEI